MFDINKLKKIIKQAKKNDTMQNVEYNFRYKNDEKFFEVDIHPIKAKKNKNQYIGTLLLFKDITQHKLDIKEIEEKQEIIKIIYIFTIFFSYKLTKLSITQLLLLSFLFY